MPLMPVLSRQRPADPGCSLATCLACLANSRPMGSPILRERKMVPENTQVVFWLPWDFVYTCVHKHKELL